MMYSVPHISIVRPPTSWLLARMASRTGQAECRGLQLLRIDDDLILLHEAADAGDLGDALGRGEPIAHESNPGCCAVSASVRSAPSTTYW